MRVLSLELHGYKPLPFKDNNAIVFTPSNKLTLLTGVNGSGKSSLLRELIPSVTPKDFFKKNGYKILTLEHNNHQYVIEQRYEKEHLYFFYCDGENLNTSQSVTLQKELIERHFNLSPVLTDLLTGRALFTDLTLPERKKLFNELTHLNIEKVIEYYNTLKEKVNVKNNHRKYLLNKRLETEQKILSEKEEKELLTQRKTIHDLIDVLLELRSELSKSKSDFSESLYFKLSENLDKLNLLFKTHYTYYTSYPENRLSLIELDLNTQKANIATHIKILYEQYETIINDEKLRLNLQGESEHSLLQEKADKQNQYKSIISTLKYVPLSLTIEHIEEAKRHVSKLLEYKDVFTDIQPDPDNIYTKEKRDSVIDLYARLNAQYVEEQKRHTELQSTLSHLKHNERVLICPHCLKNFSDTKDYDTVLKQYTDLTDTLSETEKRLLEAQKLKDGVLTYFSKLNPLKALINDSQTYLSFFWSYVIKNNLIKLSPSNIPTLLKQINEELHQLEYSILINNNLSEIDKKIEQLNQIRNNITTDYELLKEDIKTKLDELYTDQEHISKSLETLTFVKKLYQMKHTLTTTILTIIQQLNNQNASYIATKLIELIDNELRQIKLHLIELDNRLSSNSYIKNTLDDFDKEISSLTSLLEVDNYLITQLSPKDGIIAKTISNYLNKIISSINTIISSLWSYKMELVLFDIEQKGLDYRFGVIVDDTLLIDDISKVSSGMREIIDLAFRITLYKLLKLEHFPLYLDEFGVRLDSTHRRQISDLIFKFINSSHYSQLFLVTHLDMQYKSYDDVGVLELS